MADLSNQQFDVIVVGSGTSGGWAAKRLAEAGLKVALVDNGRKQSDANFTEHMPGFKLEYRDLAPEVIRRTRPVQKDCYACMEYNYDWFANDLEEPYSTPKDMPFSWQGRLGITGGRTNVWGRQSYRLSDLDFKAASHDGYGEDWPLSYSDLAPGTLFADMVFRAAAMLDSIGARWALAQHTRRPCSIPSLESASAGSASACRAGKTTWRSTATALTPMAFPCLEFT